MTNEKKIIQFLNNKKFKKKVSDKTKIFYDLHVDSFGFIKLITEIEIKLKKKYKPDFKIDFLNLTVKQLSRMFR